MIDHMPSGDQMRGRGLRKVRFILNQQYSHACYACCPWPLITPRTCQRQCEIRNDPFPCSARRRVEVPLIPVVASDRPFDPRPFTCRTQGLT